MVSKSKFKALRDIYKLRSLVIKRRRAEQALSLLRGRLERLVGTLQLESLPNVDEIHKSSYLLANYNEADGWEMQ